MQVFFELFSGIATILTGAVVIIVYFIQKHDQKKQAARVLLTEIRTAEERIAKMKDIVSSSLTADLPLIFPTLSWKKYSHLFISDFDLDELKLISYFYDYGELIEDFAKRNNNFFWVTTEERGRVSTQKIADIILDVYKNNDEDSVKNKEISNKRQFLSDKLDLYNVVYTPQKNIVEIKAYLDKIENITTSSCGIKLKKLAKMN